MTTATKTVRYVEVTAEQIPAGVRWDVTARNQGQTVEVAYAAWPRTAAEADEGDRFQRVTDRSDRSDRSVTYLRRTGRESYRCPR